MSLMRNIFIIKNCLLIFIASNFSSILTGNCLFCSSCTSLIFCEIVDSMIICCSQLFEGEYLHCFLELVCPCDFFSADSEGAGRFVRRHCERAWPLHWRVLKPHSFLQTRQPTQSRAELLNIADQFSIEHGHPLRSGVCQQDR